MNISHAYQPLSCKTAVKKESMRGALFAEVDLKLSTNAGPEEKVGGGGGWGEAEKLGEFCDGSQCYTLSVCFHCRCSSK